MKNFIFAAIGLSLILSGTATLAATQKVVPNNHCRNTGKFSNWLTQFKQEAATQGISRGTIGALKNVRFDKKVVARDRKQGIFTQTFLEFSGKLISKNRLQTGRAKLKKYRRVFNQIEQQYGVPGPVLASFWGLETDYGANNGNFPTLTALATLAFDCRRPTLFRPQLMDALRLIDNGDLSTKQMVGAWAGELGQVQFLPSDYYHNAVDFDGDGRRDLIRSVPDALASAANLLRQFGWQPGQPWLQEVRIPAQLPWQQADVYIQHPRAQWAQWGVSRVNGKPLPADNTPASLLLPMGRNGPAFLAYSNFQIYLKWNESLVYTTTAAYFATRLAGAKKVRTGNAKVNSLNLAEIKKLQRYLTGQGYDVGKVDGIIGSRTREAVKHLQQTLGLPADSYPTKELLRKLR